MAQVIRIHEHGAPKVLRAEQADIGAPGRGEVRIAQEAIGVNFVDTMVRNGGYPLPLPAVPGFEAAGTVTAVGPDVGGFAPGDRVAYFFAAGAYASERLIDATRLVKLPDDICTFSAATFLAKGLTAWMGLKALHTLQPGETVLVLGASGSVGSILSRWARALGATVIGVAGSRDKLAKVRAGAHHGLHAGDPALLERIREIAPTGVDVVFDLVGSATSAIAVEAVREGGDIVAIGGASGEQRYDAARLQARGIHVLRGGTPQFVNASTVGVATADLFDAMRAGFFRDIDVVHFALDDAALAHQEIAARSLHAIPILVPSTAKRCTH